MPAVLNVLSDLVGADRAGDDRGDDWMREGELEGRCCERHAVGLANGLNLGDPIHLFR